MFTMMSYKVFMIKYHLKYSGNNMLEDKAEYRNEYDRMQHQVVVHFAYMCSQITTVNGMWHLIG